MRLFLLASLAATLLLLSAEAQSGSRFQPLPFYSVDLVPIAVAAGDFNGDGYPDLVVANNFGFDISILLNAGDGSFLPAVNYQMGIEFNPAAVTVGDFNGDGRPDIAVGGSSGGIPDVIVFLGNGDGTFQAGAHYALSVSTTYSLFAVDVNGDGKLDLVASGDNVPLNVGVVAVLLGNGDGTFRSPITTNLTVNGGTVPSLVVGDFNRDGKIDVAFLANSEIEIMLGNGNGTFQNSTPFGQEMNSIATADMNRDGILDLVSANTAGTVSVWLGNGDGTFQSAVTSAYAADSPASIAIADLNHDGNPDVIVGAAFFSETSVLFGTGTAQLGAPVTYVSGTGPAEPGGITTADFNRDGNLDVAYVNYDSAILTLLFGSSTGALQGPGISLDASGPLAWGDFNGDGKLDVVSSVFNANNFGLWLGNGDGTFQSPINTTVDTEPNDLVSADFNGDGKLDVITVNSKTFSVALGNGDGTFQPTQTYGKGYNLGTNNTSVIAADLNGDGKLDLGMITTPVGGHSVIAILLGNGDGTFQPATQYSLGASGAARGLAFGDFKGDGKLDMVTSNATSNDVYVFLANGDGTFQSPVSYYAGLSCLQIVSADVNNDGKQDLVLACGLLGVMLGNGDGSFQTGVFNPYGNAQSISVADLDGDGKLDVAGAGFELEVYYGNGDGTFNYTNYGLAADQVGIGRVNGDNASDLIFADRIGIASLLNVGGTSEVLLSSPNPSTLNQVVSFHASVKASVAGQPTPTGTITFFDSNRRLAAESLQNGVAAFKTSTLTAGSHHIRAVYSGDSHFNPNASAILQVVLN